MKKRIDTKLLIPIISLAVAALIVILGATVFLVRDIDVSFGEGIDIDLKEDIVAASGLKRNQNILFIKEKNAAAAIQSAYPYLKVTNIERRFPHDVIIFVAKRNPIIKIQLDDGNFALLDREMFVVEKVSKERLDNLEPSYGGFSGVSYTISADEVKEGAVLSPKAKEPYIAFTQNIVAAFEMVGIFERAFCQFVDYVKFNNLSGLCSIEIKTKSGVSFMFDSDNLIDKVLKAYGWYDAEFTREESSPKLTKGYILYDKQDDDFEYKEGENS